LEEDEIGRKGTNALILCINSDRKFAEKFAKCISESLNVPISEKIVAKEAKKRLKKDIIICDDRGNCVGLSLKTRKPGRPDGHLDRRWLHKDGKLCSSWKNALNMPKEVFKAFKKGIIEKAKNVQANLIRQEDQPIVEKFLLSNLGKFLEEAFRRGENDLHLFAVMEYENEKSLYVFRMDDIIKFVEENVKTSGIKFGANISIGDFLWIQRKAGDGKRANALRPKTDPNHPGNQLQVKVLPIALKDAALKKIKYCKFDMQLEFSAKLDVSKGVD